MTEKLSPAVVTGSTDPRHWRVRLRALRATFTSEDYPRLATFVARVAATADELGHHPDLTLSWGRASVSTTTHDVRGLTARDVELATRISAIADDLGLGSTVPGGSTLEIAIDALDLAAVWPFWAAVLDYDAHVTGADTGRPDDLDVELVDRDGLGPSFWFQQMDAPRPQRNRLHVDVTVAPDEAQLRIEAALAAGGTLVSDAAAPNFWVLADAEGNEACVTTWQARS